MPLSVRTRFEVFKRDSFTCQYCGRKSPEVVLEVDHIAPVCQGGSDDTINLTTACWECNSGKSGKPLSEILTGEDPHDKAILLLERERQIKEYNEVSGAERARRESDGWDLVRYWKSEQGFSIEDLRIGRQDWNWLLSTLKVVPREQIREYMDVALLKGRCDDFRYVGGCCRKWRSEHCPEAELANAG